MKLSNKESREGALLSFLVYAAQWLIWSAWEGLFVPLHSGYPWFLMDETVIMVLVWVIPSALLFRGMNRKLATERPKAGRFPWLACLILLCAEVAALHSMRIVRGLINTKPIFHWTYLVISISAGVTEEWSFRGLQFPTQEAALGFWPASLINGLLFTLFHYPELLFGSSILSVLSMRSVLLFSMGVVFCGVYHRWRNLGLNMILHTAWNLLSFLFCLT